MSDMSAFRTSPQSEFKAEEELRQAGYSAFVPTEYRYRRTGASRTRRTKIRVPMCPGYVFGAGKPAEARYVRKRVGTLKRDEFGHLQDISGREIDTRPKPTQWQAGDSAVITTGPFEGTPVTILESRGKAVIVKGFMFNADRELAIHILQLKPPNPK